MRLIELHQVFYFRRRCLAFLPPPILKIQLQEIKGYTCLSWLSPQCLSSRFKMATWFHTTLTPSISPQCARRCATHNISAQLQTEDLFQYALANCVRFNIFLHYSPKRKPTLRTLNLTTADGHVEQSNRDMVKYLYGSFRELFTGFFFLFQMNWYFILYHIWAKQNNSKFAYNIIIYIYFIHIQLHASSYAYLFTMMWTALNLL